MFGFDSPRAKVRKLIPDEDHYKLDLVEAKASRQLRKIDPKLAPRLIAVVLACWAQANAGRQLSSRPARNQLRLHRLCERYIRELGPDAAKAFAVLDTMALDADVSLAIRLQAVTQAYARSNSSP